MTEFDNLAIMFGLLLFTLATGLWIFAAITIVSFLSLYLLQGFPLDRIGSIASQLMYSSVNSWELASVPMFVFMGELLLHSDIPSNLYRGLGPIVRYIPGRLYHTTIIGSAIFASICGSSTATAATVGKVTIRELTQQGYDSRITVGAVAAAGGLGILIPPSIALIIYGILAQVSIIGLFLAGILPGLMIAFIFSLYIAVRCHIQPDLLPERDAGEERFSVANVLGLLPVFALIVLVLGSIYSGISPPSEAAAIGVAGAVVLQLVTGQLRLENVTGAIRETIKTSTMICSIIFAAAFLSATVGYLHIPTAIRAAVDQMQLRPPLLILVLFLLYLILGCFLDGVSMMVMTLPITLPLAVGAGFDPMWFGIFLVVVIELGTLTPPVGLNLFVVAAISGLPVERVALASLPFFALMCLSLLLLVVFPEIALWLPKIL